MLVKAFIVLLIVCPAIVKGVQVLIELTLLISAVWVLCDLKYSCNFHSPQISYSLLSALKFMPQWLGRGLHSTRQDFLLQGKSTLSLSDLFCSPHSQQIPKTTVSGFV